MEEGRECAYDTVSGTQEAKSVVILQKIQRFESQLFAASQGWERGRGLVWHAGVLETCVRAHCSGHKIAIGNRRGLCGFSLHSVTVTSPIVGDGGIRG